MCLRTTLLFIIFAISSSSIIAQSGVTIREPAKSPYYFSDNHPPSYYDGNAHLPVIFTNPPHYDPTNDIVWLNNDKIKIGINLKRGGQLAWASKQNATANLVYNGYDGGFQVTLDSYQKKDGYTQNGKVSHSGPNNSGPETSYNVTQGGDFSNHAVSLIDYHAIPNGYYVKLRPIFYTLNSEISETFIEAKYTIISNSVKIEYRYTSFRTDGQWDGGGFDGAAVPACFIVNTLNKYRTYSGGSPWTNAPTDAGELPNETVGQRSKDVNATEFWGMVYDANHPESGIGIYSDTDARNSQYFQFKQKEVYSGNGQGTEFQGGYTYFHSFVNFDIPNRANYVKDITCYLIIGSETEIRNRAIEIHQGSPICQAVPNAPTNTSANPSIIAAGGLSVLNANCATGNLVWENGSSIVNPTVTTNYNVKCVSGTCESAQTSVTVTVSTSPSPILIPAPTPSTSGSHCPYQDAQGWHYWSQAENKFKSGNYFAWDSPNNRILYALSGSQGLYASLSPNVGGQPLTRQQLRNAAVSEDIIACFADGTISSSCSIPNPATNRSANPATVSAGSQSILSANCATGSVVWGNGSSIVNPTVTTTYNVKCVSGSCESTQSSVTVIVSTTLTPIPTPTPSPSGSHCPYQDIQGWHYWSQAENKFKAGNYFAWDGPNNRILYVFSGSQGLYASVNPYPSTQALTRQQLRNAGVAEDIVTCFSDGTVSNTCNVPTPATNISANPATISAGSQSVLSANCATGSLVWGNGSATVNPTVTTTYNVKCVSGSCESPQRSVTVTVSASPIPAPSGSHCPYQDTQGWHYWSQQENKFKSGNYFAWDGPNNRILYVFSGSQGLYATASPYPTGQPLTRQQLRNAEVAEDIIACFSDGRARIGVTSFEKINAMNVYPNPTNGIINVDFYLEKDENISINLYDFQGKNMDFKNIDAHEGNNKIELDLKSYPMGTYFINLQSSEKREVQKIIRVN